MIIIHNQFASDSYSFNGLKSNIFVMTINVTNQNVDFNLSSFSEFERNQCFSSSSVDIFFCSALLSFRNFSWISNLLSDPHRTRFLPVQIFCIYIFWKKDGEKCC